jgi:hypothetical protein
MANLVNGYLYDEAGKMFDITVILNWPKEEDYEQAEKFEDCPGPKLVDFHFGEPNDEDTEFYFGLYLEKQNKFKKLLDKLYNLKAMCPEDTEIEEQIEFIKQQINPIY